MSTTYTTQVSREAPEIEAYKVGLLQEAQRLYGTPINLPAVEAAGLSLGQIQAADLARQGIGAYEPYLQAGSQAITQGMGLTQQGAQQLANLNLQPQFGAAQGAFQGALGATSRLGGLGDVAAGYSQADLRRANQQLEAAMTGAGGIESAGAEALRAGVGSLEGLGNRAAGYSEADLRRANQQLEAAMRQAGGIEAAGAQALQAGVGALGAGAYKDYYNPFEKDVISATEADLARQGEMARTALAGQAARSGAFGSTREGVQRAILEGELVRNKADVLANLRSQGFNTAQQAALSRAGLYGTLGTQAGALRSQQAAMQGQLAGQSGQQALQAAQLGQAGVALGQLAGQYGALGTQAAALRAQQAGMQGQLAGQSAQQALQQAQLGQAGTALQGQLAGQEAGLYGTLGQGIGGLAAQQGGLELQRAAQLGAFGGQMGQLGVQQGALGQTLQGLGAADVQLMAGIGGLEQQNAQAQLDAIRATQTQENLLPFQQLGFVSDIYRGAPTTQMALTSQTAPTASPLQTALGLGIAGLGAASGAQRAGLFG